jgi:hypothetical protein
VAEVGARSEPAGFINDLMELARVELGRRVLRTWMVHDQPIDEITEEDCRAIASCIRKRAAALGGSSVRGKSGIDDPMSLEEFAEYLERSGGILITA